MTATTTRVATRTVALPYAVAGLAGAAVIVTFGNLDVAKGENGGLGPAISTGVVCVILTAALFGLGVPRWRGRPRPTVVLGALTVLSLAAFWSGAVAVLAATTAATAPAVTTGERSARIMRTAALIAAGIAIAFTVVNYLS